MKEFLQGLVVVLTTIITAVVVFPLLPIWTLSIWLTGDDDLIDSAVDAFDAYMRVIKLG